MIKVLVVDDSAVARTMLSRGLGAFDDIQVIGGADNAYSARDRIVLDDPDVVTLDINMPGMDGVEFLSRLMPQYPKPVVIVSSIDQLTAEMSILAMEAGAVDLVVKPVAGGASGIRGMFSELASKIRTAAQADVSAWRRPARGTAERPESPVPGTASDIREKIIGIGASTGGTAAVADILSRLPSNLPGIAVVLHMPPVFTQKYAERLDRMTDFDVGEAQHGDVLQSGRVLVAPGDRHLNIGRRVPGGFTVDLSAGSKVNGHLPSVGVLFESMARKAMKSGIGVLLTGMGRDGASELLELRRAGGRTVAQDKDSSVVWGMPAEAVRLGAAEYVLSLEAIPSTLVSFAWERL